MVFGNKKGQKIMRNNKKKICLITNWYPTKDKPYNGIFFKEQAFSLKDDFDFTIIHYKERKKDLLLGYAIRCLRGKVFSVNKVNEERNTTEYNVTVNLPGYLTLVNLFYDIYQKVVKHASVAGTGFFVSKAYQKKKKKVINKIFTQNFLDEIDVLYCVNAQEESYTLQCISKVINKPYVVSEHAPFPWPGFSISDIEKEAIENADCFMAISYDKIRQLLLQNVKLKKIILVGNLVDENQFQLKNSKNQLKTFIIVAAHSFYKNYDLFVEIFNRLTEITGTPFKVMIVGYGSNKGYSKNVEELEEKIHNSKFAHYAELIPEISHEKIQDVYAQADAFVMTSIQEGMPVSALEAACCGLPIFSTMCGGVEDYVDDSIGRIYKIIDSEAFANGLKDFLEERIVFDSQHIRKSIVEKYGKRAFTKRMARCFNDAIDNYNRIQ